MPDPLQQQQHQLPVLLPAQLKLLRASQGVRGHQGLPGATTSQTCQPPLTLAFTPSCTSGTRGMASYRDETYVMIDFSSGWGTSTSVGEVSQWGPPCKQQGGAGRRGSARTLRVQEPCHSQVPLCHREGLVQVLQVGLTIHLVHVDKHGPVGKVVHGPGRWGCRWGPTGR